MNVLASVRSNNMQSMHFRLVRVFKLFIRKLAKIDRKPSFFLASKAFKTYILSCRNGSTNERQTMAKGKRQEMQSENGNQNGETSQGNGMSSGNGIETPDESAGARMWQTLLTPGSGDTFAERWSHLRSVYLGAYGEYRVTRQMPVNDLGEPEITLHGKDAVAYVLGEIPSPEQEGFPVSFFDALAKAAKGKPHNSRRNFGEELFDKVVDSYIENYQPYPESATRTERKELRDAVAEGFRDWPADDCENLDKFLIKAANELKDSEDMRRKVKTREKKAETAKVEKVRPVIDREAMRQRLAQVG